MKKTVYLATVGMMVCAGFISCERPADAASPADPQAQTLKEAFAGSFLIGASLNESHFDSNNPEMEDLISSQFNTITPENVMKWETIHPELNRYDFTAADRLVAYGEKHGMFIVGHTLVWHNQLPPWVFEDNGKQVSREVLIGRMQSHIHTIVGRYKGRIKGWDVLNEALSEDGSLRKSPWLEIIGEDYIRLAFQFAHEADPEVALYYNDYSLENEPKRNGAIRLVQSLKAAGVKIDGVGLQGHVQLDWPSPQQLDETLTAIGQLGVRTMITELDIDILPGPDRSGSAEITLKHAANPALNPYKDGLPEAVQQALAKRYADLFSVYLKHRGTLERVTFWGVTDGNSWLNDWPVPGRSSHPLLFDRQGRAKPALKAVINTAIATGRQEVTATSATQGAKIPSPFSPKPKGMLLKAAAPVLQVSTSNTEPKQVPATPVRSKPNFVIFLADDLAWHDVACFGGPTDAKTPHLDQLASEGIKLTGFHSSAAVCSPVRQALLTGLYPVRNGAYPNHAKVNPGTRSLPHHLKPLGYRTVGAGKKHFDPEESFPFDQWIRFVGEDKQSQEKNGAIDFVKLEEFIKANPDQPFCAYIAPHEPHGPWTEGNQSAYNPAQLKNIAPHLVDTPELRQGLAEYYAEVSLCDQQVGKISEILKRTGQDQNTIFIFASEQGSSLPQGKWTLYNPGIRVAAIARWPEKIKPGSSNSALVQYVDLLPTLIEAAGGDPAKADAGQPDTAGKRGFDGRSMLNVLLNQTDKHRDHVFAQHTTRGIINGSDAYGSRAVSNGKWKLIVNLQPENKFTNAISNGEVIQSWRKKGEQGDPFASRQAARYGKRPATELYDLSSDPWELSNIVDDPKNASTLANLRSELDSWMKQQGDKGAQTELQAFEHQAGGGERREARNEKAKSEEGVPEVNRSGLFEKKDSNGDGRVSLQEFSAKQSDAERATTRFTKGDKDKDGFLAEEEFSQLPAAK